jgi:chromosome segregation ATPase
VNHTFGFLIESSVAVLLVVTIAYCAILERRLRRLRADEKSLKATITELVTATEIAERAIKGLKSLVQDCDQNLEQRLKVAERLSQDIARQTTGAEQLLARLERTGAAPRAPREESPDAKAMLAAAKAFAERTRSRISGAAA